jgi:hypothetical protein
MTDLLRIGTKIRRRDHHVAWRVEGLVEDYSGAGEPTRVVLSCAVADVSTIPLSEFWQRWTPVNEGEGT